MDKKYKLILNEDYYIDSDGRYIFTALFLYKRGVCCGNKCLNCPYIPVHSKGSKEKSLEN